VEPDPIGPMLRRLRLGADLTLERLSELSGVSDRALSDIERGVARGPQHRTVVAIARALGLSGPDHAAMVEAARAGRRYPRPGPPSLPPMPRDVPDFTGREDELARITAALTGPRPPLVVVTGPPGDGKTSLAVRAAHLLRDTFTDQLFVELGGTTPRPPPAEVVATRTLRALTGQEGPPGAAPEQLRRVLADRSLLLVLDDAAAESQIRAVLPATRRTAVLVTSRRSLAGLDAAERIRVDRLPAEDAQRLLAAIIPADQVAGADLGRLAGLCDGVPLALRIAGNRLACRPGWTVAGLTARLAVADHRLDGLTAGDLQMRRAIERSFAQLEPAAQRLFRRLALIDGRTFGADLAGALLQDRRGRAEELLDELTDLHLVQPAAEDRYALPDLHRLYALAQLATHESPAARDALRSGLDEWLLSTAARAARQLLPRIRMAASAGPDTRSEWGPSADARSWLTDEAENWSAALERRARKGDRPDADLADIAACLQDGRTTIGTRSGTSEVGTGARSGDRDEPTASASSTRHRSRPSSRGPRLVIPLDAAFASRRHPPRRPTGRRVRA
jgi:transcriptional regulator with XRE-family HTH domain